MKPQLIPLFVSVGLIGLLGACKRSDQTQSQDQTGQTPTAVANSKNGVVLKAKWPVGTRYVYRMELDQHSTNKIPQMPKPMQQDTTMAMTYALGVTKETDNNGHELEMEFIANEMEVKMGEQVLISFDSKETGKTDGQNPFAAPFRKMIGTKLHILVDANGRM